MPTRGSVSSRYGMRNGRMHKGLDIAASTGTSIKAADGGKVVFAGRKGAYGNLVEIDHGNGYKTRYGHCSAINVKRGDKVYKGQVIAKVGNTGRSTGPHLHFEVIKNGGNQNPASYVR
jgi:murein DD-endopeptidase MepM/ murein hydrolase activator NlpD